MMATTFSCADDCIRQPTVTAELILMTKPSIYYTGARKEKKFDWGEGSAGRESWFQLSQVFQS